MSTENKIGDGRIGLDEEQKKYRKELIIGEQANKFKGLGLNREQGVSEIKSEDFFIIGAEGKKIKETTDIDFSQFPTDIRGNEKHKILNVKINDDGSGEINGILLDGKENTRERSTYCVGFMSDDRLAKLEEKQFNEGKLKEFSQRTEKIHQEKGNKDKFLAKGLNKSATF